MWKDFASEEKLVCRRALEEMDLKCVLLWASLHGSIRAASTSARDTRSASNLPVLRMSVWFEA